MNTDFLQFCYVTNHLDRAVETLRGIHGMGAFKELRELHLPTGEGREAHCHFALAFKAGMQFEVIQPLSGDIGLYQDGLPNNEFAMKFHHLGRHISSVESYREALAVAKSRWSIPINMAEFGGYYAYADARRDYGHYLEFFCFPPGSEAIDAPRY